MHVAFGQYAAELRHYEPVFVNEKRKLFGIIPH